MGEMWLSGECTEDCGERDCWVVAGVLMAVFFMACVAQATPAFLHSSGTMPLRHWSDGKQSLGMVVVVDVVAIGVCGSSSNVSKSKYSSVMGGCLID